MFTVLAAMVAVRLGSDLFVYVELWLYCRRVSVFHRTRRHGCVGAGFWQTGYEQVISARDIIMLIFLSYCNSVILYLLISRNLNCGIFVEYSDEVKWTWWCIPPCGAGFVGVRKSIPIFHREGQGGCKFFLLSWLQRSWVQTDRLWAGDIRQILNNADFSILP